MASTPSSKAATIRKLDATIRRLDLQIEKQNQQIGDLQSLTKRLQEEVATYKRVGDQYAKEFQNIEFTLRSSKRMVNTILARSRKARNGHGAAEGIEAEEAEA